MFYRQASDQYINEGTAFEVDGVQYPANWLNLSSPEEKNDLGLTDVQIVGEKKDDRFYWVSESLSAGVLTITNTPKDLDQCKKTATDQVNATAYSLLLPSDWMVVKSVESSVPVAPEWNTYRASIRATANTTKSDIENATDVDALASIQISWPASPDAVIEPQSA